MNAVYRTLEAYGVPEADGHRSPPTDAVWLMALSANWFGETAA